MPVAFQVEKSYEATTLDYLSPRWYPVEGVEFATKEEAEAYCSEQYAARVGMEPCAFRPKRVLTGVERDEFLEAEFEANRQYWAGRAEAARIQEANTPSKGKTVEVVRGRKVPIGTTGYVIWYGEGQWGWRVGIKDAAGEVHWTAASNVAVVHAEEVAA